jgi:hypothetical protein
MDTTGLTQSQALIALLYTGLAGVHDTGMHRDAPECDAPWNAPRDVHRDTPWDAPTEIAALVARVEALEAAVAKPETRRRRKSKPREFNPERHYLGALCERGHNWEGTGQSRYSKRNKACMECEAEGATKRRAAKKATGQQVETGS